MTLLSWTSFIFTETSDLYVLDIGGFVFFSKPVIFSHSKISGFVSQSLCSQPAVVIVTVMIEFIFIINLLFIDNVTIFVKIFHSCVQSASTLNQFPMYVIE